MILIDLAMIINYESYFTGSRHKGIKIKLISFLSSMEASVK